MYSKEYNGMPNLEKAVATLKAAMLPIANKKHYNLRYIICIDDDINLRLRVGSPGGQ